MRKTTQLPTSHFEEEDQVIDQETLNSQYSSL